MKKVLVFGVFDGLHEGHKFFLKEAKKLGDYLVVVITPDEVVKNLKRKTPQFKIDLRIQSLKNLEFIDEIIVGDDELGSWKILDKAEPNIIALGYDQKDLKSSLKSYLNQQRLGIDIETLPPFFEAQYKSSLINSESRFSSR